MPDLFSLKGRVALVTGASSGIGRHCARVYAEAGAKVVALARRASELDALVGEIEAAGQTASALAVDLLDVDDWDQLAARASESFGAPDILFNGVGINLRQPYTDVTADDWRLEIDLNLSVPFFLSRALVGPMMEQGSGNIINVASLQSDRAFANSMPYGAAKGGVAQLTRAMAQAWSPHGVVCNAVQPGFFPTELTERVFADEALAAHHAAATAIGRNGEMDDLTGPLIFLASRASHYVTGHVLPVEGGYLAT